MSSEAIPSKVIVFELGEYNSKIGFAGQQEPLLIPTIMVDSGKPIINIQQFSLLYSINRKKYYGLDAAALLETLYPNYILKKHNLGELLEFIKYAISFLLKDQSVNDYGLLFLHKPSLAESDKLFFKDVFLNIIGLQSIAFLPENFAIMTALSKDTAVMIDLGESASRAVSIFKNFPNLQANQESMISSSIFSTELSKSLKYRTEIIEEEIFIPLLSEIKKNAFFVSQSPDKDYETCKADPKEYLIKFNLPDGSEFTLDSERFMIPELYFRPELKDYRANSIVELVKQSIGAWERDQVPELLKNIILYGGGSHIPGLKERLENEVKKQFPSSLTISITDFPNIPELSWVCGSAAVSKNLIKNWISKGGSI